MFGKENRNFEALSTDHRPLAGADRIRRFKMIIDLMKFTIKAGRIDDAIEVMKKQMANNLGDEGCLMSNVFRSNTNTDELYLLLGWENQDAIDKHLMSSHDLKFREDLDPLLSEPPEFFDWEKLA